MKIKVCGMRDKDNIEDLIALNPDYIGFIFFEKSNRFVKNIPRVDFPKSIKKVGVFVNESKENVLEKVKDFQLDCVQLHGDENPGYCKNLKSSSIFEKQHIQIIKAFSVDENFDFSVTFKYQELCDYFLFDTKGKNYGGNGVKFNWEILNKYKGKTPFLLSGGISKNDAKAIKLVSHKSMIGIDINSGFEEKPAIKNINEIKEFKKIVQ